MIISLSGKIGSGKDEVAKMIQSLDKKWEVRRFADKLKDIVCLLIGCTRKELENREFKEKELREEWNCWINNSSKINNPPQLSLEKPSDFFNDLCGVSYRRLTPRLILQLMGTECGRNIIHPQIWVNSLFADYHEKYDIGKVYEDGSMAVYPENSNWIITDCRFPNELEAIKKRKGVTIRVTRKNNPYPASDHASETSLDLAEFDYEIQNDGSLKDLLKKVEHIYEESNKVL